MNWWIAVGIIVVLIVIVLDRLIAYLNKGLRTIDDDEDY